MTAATIDHTGHGHDGHSDGGHGHDSHGHHGHGHYPGVPSYSHIMPLWILFAVFASLIALTALTVALSGVALGTAEIFVSMGIATIKALLVAVYFMHMRHDKPLNVLICTFSLVFVALFIGLLLFDSMEYYPNIAARTYVEMLDKAK
ncbi:hypothetical protein Spb1_05570 [Planctopirus ephydatiae]|uniref:Uncharacterized protein n=1 Tax=Planctopirus ephydatiae TaxID=2528019 RepID=A0A518GJC1_9PLAN|nr:cytochrome C oxidase subunit IV family protein [Planctopirus ephydatiae]QDV28692.1 hypothetical protein Spb1_05570 [Planctopirus ephydatiae]